ncbi:MAG: aspartyl protease family protein, partial [Thermoflexibacter sp.]|nr:aspartyl protease family protein [Thermoflexibacter sp.]
DTIPFELKNNLIIVKAKINNQNEYSFILDTGAPTIVWEKVALELGLEKTNVSHVSSDGNGQEQKIEFFKSKSISTGKMIMNDMNLVSLRGMSKELSCYANGGILGGNFLMNYNLQIDFVNKRIIACTDFEKLKIPEEAIRTEAMFSMPQGQILIDDIQFLNRKDYFIMDTGFTGEFELASDLGEANLKRYEGEVILKKGLSSLSTGGRIEKEAKYIKTKLITPFDTIDNVILSMNAPRSKIGNKYLSQFETITIHYTSKEKAVYFGKKQTTPFSDLSFGFGHYYDEVENKFKIKDIYSNSGAQKAGLQVGDVILSVNNTDLSDINFEKYCISISEGKDFFMGSDNNDISLMIQRGREIMSVTLQKSPLFK